MKDARTEIRDSVVVLENFDPTAYENAEPPLVSIYLPIERAEREGRRDEWDKTQFKDLKEEAERTLRNKYPNELDWQGIHDRLEYLLDSPDLPIWINAGKSLALLVSNDNVYVFNLEFAVDPCVVVSDTYYTKPLLRNFQYGMHYYLLLLGSDRFSLLEGDYDKVRYKKLPPEVADEFAKAFIVYDGEEAALDYESLENHMPPYHHY
ncbi:MAG: hypothetical protein LUB61_06605, partial [Eggerthellaceae bacterium]|nr:hypothetical protein [Eggerthellaceae bacterium]